ncbi:MAG: thioredoxin [Alphaproteobacteria bacterium]
MENIYDVNMNNFSEKVMNQSMETPVVVDFWAPWCGPCKELMPNLEAVVNSHNGKVKLAKINIDENQQMAQQMQVKSVPTVAIIYKGQPVDGFNGNIPKSEIEAKINAVLGGESENNESSEQLIELLEQSETAIKTGDYDTALPLFMEILEITPDSPIAIAGLAKCYINMGELDAAESMLTESEHQDSNEIKEALSMLSMAKNAGDMGDIGELKSAYENDKNNMQSGLDYATALFGLSKHQEAVDIFLELFAMDKNWNDGIVKTELLKCFEVLGFENPIAIDGRKRLSSLMFV